MWLFMALLVVLEAAWVWPSALAWHGIIVRPGSAFANALLAFEGLIALQGWLAWGEGFLTPRQLQLMRGTKGLPFLAHGGMWGDALIISPLVALIVAYYGTKWSPVEVTVAMLVGLVSSFAMHETYRKIPWPEAHVRHGYLTDAGWAHLVYMAAAFAVILLYFFHAPYTPWMWAVSALLIVHVTVGTHVVLGLLRPAWYPGRPLENAGTWSAVSGTAGLTLLVTALRAFRVW